VYGTALIRTNPPDLIHCSSPGALIWTATGLAEKYKIPLVQSYHTHIPHYIPQYTGSTFLVKPMWDFIRLWTRKSDVTMVTSTILEGELKSEGCPRLEVWQKGVDTVAFNPKFRSEAMRARLRGGRKDGKIIGCVGRLGAEKNLAALKAILAKCPEGTNLAIVGDGPEKAKLEEHFAGTNTHFTGMITGDDLAAAYASLDVFVMPSESGARVDSARRRVSRFTPCISFFPRLGVFRRFPPRRSDVRSRPSVPFESPQPD
jgi:sulfoquinovosyltransferase